MISVASLRQLVAAGMTAEQIVDVVEAELAADAGALEERRSRDRDRKARQRSRDRLAVPVTSRKSRDTHDQPIETIEDFKASADADDKTASLTYLLTSTEDSLEGKKEGIGVTRARGRNANKRDRLHVLPEGWRPPERAYAVAREAGTTVEAVLPVFLDYLSSSGKLYANHDAAFCNFIRNAPKFSGNGNGRAKDARTRILEEVFGRNDGGRGQALDGDNTGLLPGFARR